MKYNTSTVRIYCCCAILFSVANFFLSIMYSFWWITVVWSVLLDFPIAIAVGSGFARLIWNFLVTSRKYVLIIFAINGISVSSLYLKKAINTHRINKGREKTKAVAFGVPLFISEFHTHKVIPIHTAKIAIWTMLIVTGPTVIPILNSHLLTFLGINIFIIEA